MDLLDILDVADEIAHLTGGELLAGAALRDELADFEDLVGRGGLEEADLLPLLDRAVDDPHIGDGATVAVVVAVEDHRAEDCGGIPSRRRDPLDDRPEQLIDADARLGTRLDDLGRVDR